MDAVLIGAAVTSSLLLRVGDSVLFATDADIRLAFRAGWWPLDMSHATRTSILLLSSRICSGVAVPSRRLSRLARSLTI